MRNVFMALRTHIHNAKVELFESNGNTNIVRIPFEKGIRHPFFDKDNLREQRWKKYVLPTITGSASMAAAVMGTSTATIYNVNSNVTRNV